MNFYRIKVICYDLGISPQTLYNNIKQGKWPKLEHPNPVNTRMSGYCEKTFEELKRSINKG